MVVTAIPILTVSILRHCVLGRRHPETRPTICGSTPKADDDTPVQAVSPLHETLGPAVPGTYAKACVALPLLCPCHNPTLLMTIRPRGSAGSNLRRLPLLQALQFVSA